MTLTTPVDSFGFRIAQPWREAEIHRMRTAWQNGLSATEIARLLPGRNRAMVLGKIHRYRLKNGWCDFPAREVK